MSLNHNLPFVIAATLYVVLVGIALAMVDLPFVRPLSYIYNLLLYLASAVFLLGVPFLYDLARERPDSPLAYARLWAVEKELTDRFILALPALAALVVFLPSFSAFKSAITLFNEFSFDPSFATLDAQLHGGDAWLLIQPVVGYPIISFLLNWVYQFWILLLYPAILIVLCWMGNPRLRSQFLVTFVLCWAILGTVAAVAFASVGPCFYEHFYGDDRFVPLMTYLENADRLYPLAALEIQDQLLQGFSEGDRGLGRGISAMPSMHLSIACLFAILGWKISRLWGILSTIFLFLILLGSVHLGYHYAIDGYVSIIATIGLWWIVGRALRRIAPA